MMLLLLLLLLPNRPYLARIKRIQDVVGGLWEISVPS
jgi:hypothetical protein